MRSRIVNSIILSATLLFATSALLFTACNGCSTSQQRQSINTIRSTADAVNTAYAGYLDLVIRGDLKTNDVPRVSEAYNAFQLAFSAAITVATVSSNSPPSPELANAASQALLTIQSARGK